MPVPDPMAKVSNRHTWYIICRDNVRDAVQQLTENLNGIDGATLNAAVDRALVAAFDYGQEFERYYANFTVIPASRIQLVLVKDDNEKEQGTI